MTALRRFVNRVKDTASKKGEKKKKNKKKKHYTRRREEGKVLEFLENETDG